MASVNDYGRNTEDVLSAPALGSNNGWAAAVAAALDSSDTTVNARITAHEAKADPHPVYLNIARGDARYSTGQVVVGLVEPTDPKVLLWIDEGSNYP